MNEGKATSIQRALDGGGEVRVTLTGGHRWSGHSGRVMSEMPPLDGWFCVLLDNGEDCGAPAQLMSLVKSLKTTTRKSKEG